EIDLGFHHSGDLVNMQVMDSDSGLEFGDDLLYSADVRVPWCSAFHADTGTAECEEDYAYNCDGMAWAMPTQPWCNETSWIYLGSSSDSEGAEADCEEIQDEVSCLRLQFMIIPFQVGW
ncbi:unnamed protein product, partial [Hapterophycus canaliculatus]